MLIENICNLPFEGVRRLTVDEIGCRQLTELEIDHFLRSYSVHWVHSGDKDEPHALLTSGRHSGEYYDCTFVLQKSAAAKIIAAQLALKLKDITPRSWIVGPSFGAIFLVSHLATKFDCFHGITERVVKDQFWERFYIPSGFKVQPVEDVISTGGSTLKTIEAIKNGNLEPLDFYPRVAAIVNRSGLTHIGDFEIVSLLSPKDVKIYTPYECPMCKAGSKPAAMKPWLMKKYGKTICE